ncbi:MAG: hypothetical protein ACXWQZ_21150 [Ktedonobacterales bacterium]
MGTENMSGGEEQAQPSIIDAQEKRAAEAQQRIEQWQQATEAAVPEWEAPAGWELEAMTLHQLAVSMVNGYLALCDGKPLATLAELHGTRDVSPSLFRKILDKMEERAPGSAGAFLTLNDTGSSPWRNPYQH